MIDLYLKTKRLLLNIKNYYESTKAISVYQLPWIFTICEMMLKCKLRNIHDSIIQQTETDR